MRIRIWNAYASNNSGSYSIVGTFPSAERADQVAAELLPVIRAHSEWMNTRPRWGEPPREDAVSPLEQWVAEQGLQWSGFDEDEWPEYSGDNVPSLIAAGAQVLIHEECTAAMPKVFGEYFYRRGGRVDRAAPLAPPADRGARLLVALGRTGPQGP